MWEDRKKQELKEAAIAVPRCYGASATVLRATVLRKESHQEPRKDEGRTFSID